MRLKPGIARTVTTIALTCALSCAPLFAQTPSRPRSDQDVVRVDTNLVQTDVMVFDKQGRFIDGLKKEDFELRVDGQPKPIDFFERITAGSASEEIQLAAARGANRNPEVANAPVPLDRGRPIFFYLDDLHLDLASLKAAKKMITGFIDNQMGQNDEVAITSASGQIGFLQQLTDNKTVLKAALNRVNPRAYIVRDGDSPPMTEFQALQMETVDRELFGYFVAATMAENPGMDLITAQTQVHTRANSILRQANNISLATLSGLDSLVRSAKAVTGRKLVFFVSGGFFLNHYESAVDRLRTVTAVAAKNGVVIYAIDARGLVIGLQDAKSDQGFDLTGALARSAMGELTASQDALNALSRDTGGKPVFNTNDLSVGLTKALKDTSIYYLLAWKPEGEAQHASKFHRIEVKVIGRPELSVQVRRGFYDVEPEPLTDKTKPKPTQTPEKAVETELQRKLASPYPVRDIPVSLDLSYLSTSDKGWMLNTMMEIPTSFLTFQNVNGKERANVNVIGYFYNDRGQVGGTFNNQITVEPRGNDAPDTGSVKYNYPLYLKPGLYHVRVGAQDVKSGRTGSAHGWVEVPNLEPNQLGLSSVLVGLRPPDSTNNSTAEMTETLTNSVDFSAAHRFDRDANLRFVIFVYNATLTPDTKTDLALSIQMIRDGQPVVTTPLKKIPTDGVPDPKRIPYAGEIPLRGLSPGRYLLQVTIIDRLSKQSASQQTRFEIE